MTQEITDKSTLWRLGNVVMRFGIAVSRCGLAISQWGVTLGAGKPDDAPRLPSWADDDEPLDDAGLTVEIKVARDPNRGHRVRIHTNGRLELRAYEAEQSQGKA